MLPLTAVTFTEKESLFSPEKFRMNDRKAIYQFIHEDSDRENGKPPSPVPFIDCSHEWAEQNRPALPQGTGRGCTSEMGECLSQLDRFPLKTSRPSYGGVTKTHASEGLVPPT